MTSLPLFVRKAIVDFVETALAGLFGMALVFPTSTEDLKAIGVAVGFGLLGAGIAAARRAIPGFLAYLKEQLGTGE